MGRTAGLSLGVVGLCLLGVAHAEPNKVLYELQERCGKQAADTFKKEMGDNITNNNDGGQTIANFENHYNARLNKCFYLERAMIIHPRAKERKASTSLRLFDLHENREFGSYFQFDPPLGLVMQCEVGSTSCHSEQEWRALAKPFLED
jgi:hypothetical protein